MCAVITKTKTEMTKEPSSVELFAKKAVLPPQIDSFAKFYPYYLTEHKKPKTKLLHFIGRADSIIP